MAIDRRLSDEEAAAVFRRAAELDVTGVGPPDGGFDRATVERIATEAGISEVAVRRALAEFETGQLDAEPSARGWRARLGYGRSRRTITRAVARPAATVAAELDGWLRGQTLRPARRAGPVTVWEKAEGLGSTIVRSTDVIVGGRIRLQAVHRVEVSVAEAGPDACEVRVVLDFTSFRRSQFNGGIIGVSVGGAGATAAGVVAAAGAVPALLGVPGGIGFGALIYRSVRNDYFKQRDRAIGAVELKLDELGDRPPRQ